MLLFVFFSFFFYHMLCQGIDILLIGTFSRQRDDASSEGSWVDGSSDETSAHEGEDETSDEVPVHEVGYMVFPFPSLFPPLPFLMPIPFPLSIY